MSKKIKVRDLTLRDGQQSKFATRMRQDQVDRVLPYYREANFYAMEVWGGAVPDSTMRYLNENPWNRLETINRAIGDTSKLTALSRGRNLFGYNPYPDETNEGFCRNAIESGVDIMRIFDCLNDINNMKSTIKFVQQNGGMVDCAICYTVDPKLTLKEKIQSFLRGKGFPKKVFGVDYYVNKAKELEKLGADIITIKDMAGLIHPEFAHKLMKKLKAEISAPINLHSHSTPGYGLATALVSIIQEVDIVDTAIMNFSGGTAAPAFELVQIFAQKLDFDTGINLKAVATINKELREIRRELSDFDKDDGFPIPFDISDYQLPPEIDALFDKAIFYAKKKKFVPLLETVHEIEAYFNFPNPDEAVKNAEIPGGMYSNMIAQLEAAKLTHHLDRVLEVVPKVRLDAGCPPLVTPTSQIVGVQAVRCVMDEANGKEPFYTSITKQFADLVQGQYGETPVPVDPDFRKKIAGSPEEIPYDTSQYQKPENPILPEFGNVHLAQTEKEELLLELFPSVAERFLMKVRENEYQERILAGEIKEEKQEIVPMEGYILADMQGAIE
jgi:pyruvate/oxaloacetate carboxyltransferase